MKKLFLSVFALFCATIMFAQNNTTSITTDGDNNKTSVSQAGNDNSTVIDQLGDFNEATSIQGSGAFASREGTVEQNQTGDGNTAFAQQEEDRNTVLQNQIGDGNSASARQNLFYLGGDNVADQYQMVKETLLQPGRMVMITMLPLFKEVSFMLLEMDLFFKTK